MMEGGAVAKAGAGEGAANGSGASEVAATPRKRPFLKKGSREWSWTKRWKPKNGGELDSGRSLSSGQEKSGEDVDKIREEDENDSSTEFARNEALAALVDEENEEGMISFSCNELEFEESTPGNGEERLTFAGKLKNDPNMTSIRNHEDEFHEEEFFALPVESEKLVHGSLVEEDDRVDFQHLIFQEGPKLEESADDRHLTDMFRVLERREDRPRSPKEREPSVEMEENHNLKKDDLTMSLMAEMDAFRVANEKLEASLRQLEQERRDLFHVKQDFEKQQKDKGREESETIRMMQEEMRKERAQIQKERDNLERRLQHLEILRETTKLDRQGKSEVESLQAKLAQLKVAEKERTQKHKEALASKQKRITALEADMKDFEEALKFAEQKRLDLWAEKADIEEALHKIEAENAVFREEIAHLRQFSRLDIERADAFTQTPLKDSSKAKPENPKRREEVLNRNEDPVDQQAIRKVRYPNGSVKEILPSGETTTTFANGDINKVIPDGEEQVEIYYFASSDITQTKYSDGMLVREFPSGQVERELPDKTLEIFFPDGTLRAIKPDASEEIMFSNGTKIHVSPSGEKTFHKS